MPTTYSGYKLHGKRMFQGLPISIENERGSVRRGESPDGTEWATFMYYPYGYIRATEGVDGDHVDCYIGYQPNSIMVFIVHQQDPKTKKYDEDKCMLGFSTAEEAKTAYLRQYDSPGFFQSMTIITMSKFKEMLKEQGVKLDVLPEGVAEDKKKRKMCIITKVLPVNTDQELQKAKYIKRWKGKDGKWRYKYREGNTKKKSTIQTKEFKAWFGDSKVVDFKGDPLVVYHGTPEGDFKEFTGDTKVERKEGFMQYGTFFSSSPKTASTYTANYKKMLPEAIEFDNKLDKVRRDYVNATIAKDTKLAEKYNKLYFDLQEEKARKYPEPEDMLEHGSVYPVFLSLQKPLIVDGKGKRWFEVLPDVYNKDLTGHDGLIFKNIVEAGKEVQDTFVAFKPEQIKSKFNRGTFDPKDPNMRKSKLVLRLK